MIDIKIKDDIFFDIDKGGVVLTYPRLAYADISTLNSVDINWISKDDREGLYENLHITNVSVEGVVYTDIYLLQQALSTVLFNTASGGGGGSFDPTTMETLLASIDTKLDTLNDGLAIESKQDATILEIQNFATANGVALTNILNKEEEVRLAIVDLQNASISNTTAITDAILVLQTALSTKIDELKTINQAEFDELQANNTADFLALRQLIQVEDDQTQVILTDIDAWLKRKADIIVTETKLQVDWADFTVPTEPTALTTTYLVPLNTKTFTISNYTYNILEITQNVTPIITIKNGESVTFEENEFDNLLGTSIKITPINRDIKDVSGTILYNGIRVEDFSLENGFYDIEDAVEPHIDITTITYI